MHDFFHTRFGFCLWDLAALAVLVLLAAVLTALAIRQKKRESDYEDELSEKMAIAACAHKSRS